MPFKIERLEQVLRLWEDVCFCMNLAVHVANGKGIQHSIPLAGPMVHWRELRSHLLDALAVPFDGDKFIGPDKAVEYFQQVRPSLIHVPASLHAWSQDSRRVYCVEEELQHLLHVTSLKGLTWVNVPFRFRSFAILTELPFYDAKGGTYDCILVTRKIINGRGVISVEIFSTNFEKYSFLTEEEKRWMQKSLDQKKWGRIDAFLKQRMERKQVPGATGFHVDEALWDKPVLEPVAGLVKVGPSGPNPMWDPAARLVVGLCMYLKSLPSKGKHANTPTWVHTRRTTGLDPTAIIRETEVCRVSNIYKFTDEEKQLFAEAYQKGARAYYELRAHFREGYDSRPKGLGHDSLAEKSVYTRPTVVRRDRVPPGGLPHGTMKVLGARKSRS